MFLVRAGSARLARLQDSGGELTLDVAGPGDFIGEGAAFSETRRSGLAQALERLRVAPLAVSELHAALRRRPDWALALGRVVLERSRRLEERATLNALGDCRRRLIGVLLELAERFGQPEPGGCRLDVRVTHEDLARLIGAARETVTPLLVELRRRGWIDYDRRRLVIRERDALLGRA